MGGIELTYTQFFIWINWGSKYGKVVLKTGNIAEEMAEKKYIFADFY